MPTNTPGRQIGVLLGTTDDTVFTAVDGCAISAVVICNTGSVQRKVWLSRSATGGALTEAGAWLWNTSLKAGQSVSVGAGAWLEAGDEIHMKSDAADQVSVDVNLVART